MYTTPNVTEFLSEEYSSIYDTLISSTLTLCLLVGVPSNTISLLYFYSGKRNDFSSFIYTLVCSIDICTCAVQLPVIIALYNTRKPGVFGNSLFCGGWTVVFYFLQLMSMFLVMLISVSRSIKLLFLQYKVKEKFLLVSFLLYSGFIIIRFALMLFFGGIGEGNIFGYSRPSVYCSFDLLQEPLSYIDQMIHALSVGCPPIITTFSLAVFLIVVLKKNQVSKMNSKKRQAAVTMVMFTTLFLICNLPCLVNNILWFLTELWYEYPG